MPGSTSIFGSTAEDKEIVKNPEPTLMSGKQPPPVAPRTTSVQIQSWQSANSGGENWHARSGSMDSLESSGSSSSGGGSSSANPHSTAVEYIPTRTVGKIAKLPPHNPLQFVKVQSPLYKKAEQQIKLTKEVKITREALKEGEEEWQSNLDNWKSRRRKVSEKVIQRAEEMRQIEAEEQLRQDQYLQQQRKIKKFSEIVEKRSSTRTYNLDLYIGQGNDSGLGGTPEPDDTLDCQSSILRSDTSEGMTSEAESVDSDIHKSDKVHEKEPPKVPQKPQMRLLKEKLSDEFNNSLTSANHFTTHHSARDFDNFSSAEPSDIEGHTGDSETVSSEEDISYIAEGHKSELSSNNTCDQRQENYSSVRNGNLNGNISLNKNEEIEETKKTLEDKVNGQPSDRQTYSFNISIKPGDNRGFGFTLKGGKDQGCTAYIDSVTKYSPAEVAGLKEGDKIISLNGELASDYSHASLIFSIKQAVYAGILDIIISRSEKDAPLSSEIKKTTSRKSSFAEKLALFSSGVNSATPNLDESKASLTSSKSCEGKCESLVLRRRSAFENGRKESNIVHRRSSCLSQGISKVNSDNLEKRLSVDLSQCSLPENGSVKKGPPPPVPVKPKLKPKIHHDLHKTEFTKTNGCNDLEYLNSNGSIQKSDTISSDITNHGNLPNDECLSNKSDEEIQSENSSLENNDNESNNEPSNIIINEENENSRSASYIENDTSEDFQRHKYEVLSDSQKFAVNVDVPTLNFKSIDISDTNLTENSLPEYVDAFIPPEFRNEELDNENETEEILSSAEKAIESESFTSISFISAPILSDSCRAELDSPEKSIKLDFEFDVIKNEECFDEQNSPLDNNFLQTDMCYLSEEQEQCDLEDNNAALDLAINMNNISLENNSEGVENVVANTEDYSLDEAGSSPVENTEDVDNQINTSPLCLPLEKVDEDDVISASTTTSSETPDTETVIETLPSNLSPLPNDESNGEDSSKLLNGEDKETEYLSEAPVPEAPSYDPTEPSCLENSEFADNFDNNVPIQEDFTPNNSEIYESNECGYPIIQDDEYCRELDESIDKITSLDVIDEIEQQLMHQLEQQGETYEEMDEDLTAQLEQDINKQWLYITDEAELLDDLTPRNLEPPREPPPPPPPPEADTSDKKLFTRTNSTKRIKKELWRRRSDFLGLDSPEGIDVDKILPPPPALEEILKQEREQTQWLEKRLSLAETDISAPLYINDSVGMESQDFVQNEYSSDYYVEDNDGVSAVSGDSNNEQWKEHGDQSFEPTELHYNPPDMAIPPSEENQKTNESPQHKAKQNLYDLGAAPKAKIMDSNKWITEKVTPLSKKSIEPVFRQTTYNQNYWLTQDDERKRSIQTGEHLIDRRYSMPPCQTSHPDVTVRTWGDREYEFQKQRPRSAVWNTTAASGDMYDTYSRKQDLMRTHSYDGHGEVNFDSDILESEAHKCSSCGKGLCEGSAMGIEALHLYFHIQCFRCCVCLMQLGNGTCGTDVQVKNNQLYCPNCFTAD
ncbi:uncharacterized protein LOC129958281 [Argiope bruennichi]|uniref:uncharacterized protein LOC129958281 n=1 Tax=Argiope bruennichi TaxID=94029 RepID=UPI002493DFAE|nr:uncharacterized protein LOC129958281 [Argiope bruennichi]XP_055926595.1 uncharacterized protein LOC129958281 [Argiope bruennichi]